MLHRFSLMYTGLFCMFVIIASEVIIQWIAQQLAPLLQIDVQEPS